MHLKLPSQSLIEGDHLPLRLGKPLTLENLTQRLWHRRNTSQLSKTVKTGVGNIFDQLLGTFVWTHTGSSKLIWFDSQRKSWCRNHAAPYTLYLVPHRNISPGRISLAHLFLLDKIGGGRKNLYLPIANVLEWMQENCDGVPYVSTRQPLSNIVYSFSIE